MVAFSRTVPISVTMTEQIKKTEAWSYKRAVSATWERIFYGEFDSRRKKRVLVKIIGE